MIAEILLRHRHNFIQAICSSQKWRSLSAAVRSQTCWLCIFQLRSQDEGKAVLSVISSAYDPKTIEKFFAEATSERYSFLYIDLLAPTKDQMFFKTFQWQLLP